MSDDPSTKKIMALRTYADDVKRAREKNSSEEPEITEVNILEEEMDSVVEKTEEQKSETEPIPEKEKPESKENEIVELDEEPVEIPPFHFIRASSPDDTDYNDENEIPDKKSLQKSIVRKTAPPKHDPVPTHSFDIDTDEIQDLKQSIHSNRDGIFDTEEASLAKGEGSIVTDKKRKRYNLFKAIGIAMRNWFGVKKDKIVEARKPKHTVVKASRRKDVIQTASKQAKHAPSDDHLQVSDRLRDVERITTTQEIKIKSASEVPEPTWGSDSSDGEHDDAIESLEAAVSGKEVVETKDKEISEPKVTEAIPKKVPETPPPPVSPKTKNSGGYSKYRDKFGEGFAPKEEVFEKSLPSAPSEVSVDEAEKPTFSRTPVPDYRLDREGRPIKRQDGTPFLTLIAVVITAIILGVGTTVWWFTRDTSEPVITRVSQAPDLVSSQSSNDVTLGTVRTDFYSNLQESIRQSDGSVTQFYPTVGGVSAQISSIFDTLRWSAPGSFTRAVTSITFGSYESSEPFIVMKITSFDVAFGGMLTWEENISEDLAPLFGSETNTTAIDSRINNKDIRVLISVGNEDKIVYGFVNKNTILITTSRRAYSAIATLIN